MRRAEPAAARGVAFTLVFVLFAVVMKDWVPLIGAVPTAVAGVFVWRTRDVWRHNAEQWRHCRPRTAMLCTISFRRSR